MNLEPLVFTTREEAPATDRPAPTLDSASVENVHHGAVAVVSVDGGLLHRVGDPHWPTFTRSTLKAFQALPFVRDGGVERFGWTSQQIALMCASHSGEAMHTDVVRSMLASSDCDERDLQCGCHVPGGVRGGRQHSASRRRMVAARAQLLGQARRLPRGLPASRKAGR